MKKIALGLAALALTFSAMAQNETQEKKVAMDNQPAWQGGEHGRGQEMMEKLNLSDDQKAQMKAINEDFRKQMQDLNSQSLSEDARKEKRMEMMKAKKEKMSAILTEEQRKQWESMKPSAGDRKGMGEKKEQRAEKFEQMAKELNLAPEQTEKFNALQSSLKGKIKDIQSNTSLTQEQKKAEMKEAYKSHKVSVEQILTPDQRKQMIENLKNKRNEGDEK